MKKLLSSLLLLSSFLLLSHCAEEDIPGSPPIADAGEDISVPINQAGTIVLSASGSSDPDGDTLSYSWTLLEQPQGSTATINNDNEMNASLNPDALGIFRVQLSVDDGNHPPQTDEITIEILEAAGSPPVADAGDDQTVAVDATVTLDGSGSTDPDDDISEYQWTATSNPVGAQVTIENADQAQASFVPDRAGTYNFVLRVTDAIGQSATDNVTIVAQ
ncbi:MAG: PKD domain-containing protein [Cyclobacteriaceae bacterium]